MITRAIIEDVIVGEGNTPTKYRVRIPIFDNIETAREYTEKGDLSIAMACLSPDLSNDIKVGDIVFVGFEDNDISRPVILGHMYNQGITSNTTTDIKARSIQVTDLYLVKAPNLPSGTNIGEIDYQTLLDIVNKYNELYGNN